MPPLALGLLLLAADPNAPTPTDQAAAKMTLPDGFHASLFAGEPDVTKPIAMTLDDRGRLWVAESHCYPHWKTDGQPGDDRILIFEDRKGTGHFDSRKVFLDKATNLSGIAVGFGGVWLCSTPDLLYIPLKPNGDEPAGPPVVVLDGWDLKAKHNVFNQLVWGPDGWLYGCNGILSNSRVGKPGTPDAERTPINCGVWLYHQVKQKFEARHGRRVLQERAKDGKLDREKVRPALVRTLDEAVRIAKSDIDSRKQSAQSMMPEGQLTPMGDAEVRDLIAYLAGSDQPPLPKATP